MIVVGNNVLLISFTLNIELSHDLNDKTVQTLTYRWPGA